MKTKDVMIVKGFFPTLIDDLELNNSKVTFCTEYKIDSNEIALNLMKHFLMVCLLCFCY